MAKKAFNMTPIHLKFCEHYVEYGNATQAYLFVKPDSTYKTASVEGSKWLRIPEIKDKIDQLQEEFTTQFHQDLDKTIRDLFVSAEEAKKAFQFSAYAKLREMIIKLKGFYPKESIDINIIKEQPLFPENDEEETE